MSQKSKPKFEDLEPIHDDEPAELEAPAAELEALEPDAGEPEPLEPEVAAQAAEPVEAQASESDPMELEALESEPLEAGAADLEPVAAEPEPAAAPSAAAASPSRAARERRSGGGRKGRGRKQDEPERPAPVRQKPGEQSRELEEAPKILQKAAWILVAGCLFPWSWAVQTGAGNQPVELPGLGMSMAAKVLIGLGAYVFYQSLKQSYGDRAAGFAQKLDIKIKPPSRRSLGWNLGEILGLVVLLTGLLPILDGAAFLTDRTFLKVGMSLYGDKGMLALGCLTIAHIYAYSKGAHFNPLFPIMFLGPAVAGATSIPKNGIGWWTVGGVAASAAGVLAVYTIAVALRQAKAEGDAKRAAAAEARRASRQRRSRS